MQADVDNSGTLDLSEYLRFCSSNFSSFDPFADLAPVFQLLLSTQRSPGVKSGKVKVTPKAMPKVRVGTIRALMRDFPVNDDSEKDFNVTSKIYIFGFGQYRDRGCFV